MLRESGDGMDLSDPAVFEDYFRRLYFTRDLDSRHIQAARRQLDFPTVAARFRLIEDGHSHPIVVPYPGVRERVEALRANGPTRATLRALQPFLVNVYDRDFETLHQAGGLETVADTVHILSDPFCHIYDPELGLVVDGPRPDPETLVVSD
jgi:CRISPR-associated endonuclease/helicase Cas3